MGDSSDNIPGVPQIGPKTAAKLLAQYPDQETLVHAPDLCGEGKWQSLSTSLEVTRAKVIPGIAWPPRVEESDIDYELLVAMCRKRSLVRTAEKLALRLKADYHEPAAGTPRLPVAPITATLSTPHREQIALI